MNFSFNGKYKSIENIEWNNIPYIAVITGKNGTGKSQLLELIQVAITKSWQSTQQQNTFEQPSSFPEITKEFYRTEELIFLKGEWELSNLSDIGLTNIQEERDDLYQQFKQRLENLSHEINLAIFPPPVGGVNEKIYEFKDIFPKIRKRQRSHPSFRNIFNIFDDIIEKLELQENTLSKEDFLNNLPSYLYVENKDLASNLKIANRFYNYQIDLIEAKSKGISEESFISSHGKKPWEQINQLFLDSNLPFKLNTPENVGLRDKYTPTLTKINTDEEIYFSDLSSGERVIASLVFWLFNSEDQKEFPRILLLDEPDAHLHPSMTKHFFHVIKNVLCKKYNVRVILTTHSPSTVAIAPDNSIFIMKEDGVRIEKTPIDTALKILTSGIPSLSINYENRRQVFVESPNDVVFYEKLYHQLSDFLIPEISLTFISSGDSRTGNNGAPIANSDQVRKICNTMKDNNFIWGIVDHDNKNSAENNLKVLGNGNRYAIENYLFDPILLSALLLREKIFTRQELGLSKSQNHIDFKDLDITALQRISDHLTNKIQEKTTNINTNKQLKVSYVNKIELEIPAWYLQHQGHLLEEAILDAFPQLNNIKRKQENLLKLEIIDKIIDEIPEFIPLDILTTLQSIQQ